FFQAEDGIRDFHVTGVQTCALPILLRNEDRSQGRGVREGGTADRGASRVYRGGLTACRWRGRDPVHGHEPLSRGAARAHGSYREIGRASCRGRVEHWGGRAAR